MWLERVCRPSSPPARNSRARNTAGAARVCGGTVEGGFPVPCLPEREDPSSARFAACWVAPAFLCVDQSKLSAESSASSPLGRVCSCPRHQSVGMLFRVAGSSSRRSTQEHCAPSFPSRRVGPGQCRSLQVSSSPAGWASWVDCLPMVKERHPVIAGELLHALDDQRGGIHVNSASSRRDQLIGMGFLAPTWADVANGARPRRDDDWGDVPRSSTQGWQHEAASIVHNRLAESIWPGLTDSQRGLLRSQGGHMASSPFTTPPASFHARFDPQLFRVLLLRRLWQPLPPVSRICRCGRPLDSSGHHRAACANFGSPWPWRVCSRKCCRQSVQRRGRARLVQCLCAGFGCGCASRGRWETPGSGDRWPSTFAWRSVGLGCHHGVCIEVRWNPTQACSGRGWGSVARSSTSEGTHVSRTHPAFRTGTSGGLGV